MKLLYQIRSDLLLFFPESRELRKFPRREFWPENHREIPGFGNPDVGIGFTWSLMQHLVAVKYCKFRGTATTQKGKFRGKLRQNLRNFAAKLR